MKICIIIPIYNEEERIGIVLEHIINQTNKPSFLIIVDDNSTDNSYQIVSEIIKDYSWIKIIKKISSSFHSPGSKVIEAF